MLRGTETPREEAAGGHRRRVGTYIYKPEKAKDARNPRTEGGGKDPLQGPAHTLLAGTWLPDGRGKISAAWSRVTAATGAMTSPYTAVRKTIELI